MALSPPSHIQRANVIGSPITYTWGHPDPTHMYIHDYRLANRIGRISIRGVLALSTGFVEWVVWRLSKEFSEPLVFQYVEAVWAGVVDWRYLKEASDVPEAIQFLKQEIAPELTPLKISIAYLDEVFRGSQTVGKTGLSSSCLAQLALSTCPVPDVYKRWRRAVITRLQEIYPREEEDKVGPPVPREALDPDRDYDPSEANKLIAKFLAGLNPTQNPFLRTPDELTELGFEGVPYEL